MVAGYHSEYSGMKFGMFFVGEYLGVILISALITVLFFGGWLGPVLPAIVVVSDQDVSLYLFFYSSPRLAPAATLRSTHVLGLEADAAFGTGQLIGDRRSRACV